LRISLVFEVANVDVIQVGDGVGVFGGFQSMLLLAVLVVAKGWVRAFIAEVALVCFRTLICFCSSAELP